jgi:hypothetical protein
MEFGHEKGDCIPSGFYATPAPLRLGIEAQRTAIERFAASESLKIADETGKGQTP